MTNCKRVARISRITNTLWEVIVDRAGGVLATDPGAGVPALVGHAGQAAGALLVDGALRLALHIGVALQARQAGAGCCPVPLIAHCIGATGRRSAGINYLWSVGGGCEKNKSFFSKLRFFNLLVILIH